MAAVYGRYKAVAAPVPAPQPQPDDRYTHALAAAQAVVTNIAAGAGSKPMSRDRKNRYSGASEVLAAVKRVDG